MRYVSQWARFYLLILSNPLIVIAPRRIAATRYNASPNTKHEIFIKCEARHCESLVYQASPSNSPAMTPAHIIYATHTNSSMDLHYLMISNISASFPSRNCHTGRRLYRILWNETTPVVRLG